MVGDSTWDARAAGKPVCRPSRCAPAGFSGTELRGAGAIAV